MTHDDVAAQQVPESLFMLGQQLHLQAETTSEEQVPKSGPKIYKPDEFPHLPALLSAGYQDQVSSVHQNEDLSQPIGRKKCTESWRTDRVVELKNQTGPDHCQSPQQSTTCPTFMDVSDEESDSKF